MKLRRRSLRPRLLVLLCAVVCLLLVAPPACPGKASLATRASAASWFLGAFALGLFCPCGYTTRLPR